MDFLVFLVFGALWFAAGYFFRAGREKDLDRQAVELAQALGQPIEDDAQVAGIIFVDSNGRLALTTSREVADQLKWVEPESAREALAREMDEGLEDGERDFGAEAVRYCRDRGSEVPEGARLVGLTFKVGDDDYVHCAQDEKLASATFEFEVSKEADPYTPEDSPSDDNLFHSCCMNPSCHVCSQGGLR